jgi:hypothetical protein
MLMLILINYSLKQFVIDHDGDNVLQAGDPKERLAAMGMLRQ